MAADGHVSRLVLSLALSVAVVWSGAQQAQADYDGNWWYDAVGVPQAQAQGITGEDVPVAVIDLGIDPTLSVLEDANLTVREPSFCMDTKWYADLKQQAGDVPRLPATYNGVNNSTLRATNIVAWLTGNGRAPDGRPGVSGIAPRADLRFYAMGDVQAPLVAAGCLAQAEAMAVVQAVDDGARIILVGWLTTADAMVSAAVAYALHEGAIIVAPVNYHTNKSNSRWFGGLNGVIAVEAAYEDARPFGTDGDPPPRSVTVTAPGSALAQGGYYAGGSWDEQIFSTGPEIASTLVAGMLADAAQKWPEATSRQLVQSLVRNAGGGNEGLVHDPATGYGAADLLRMLQVDPTGYEDVNPLIVPDDGQEQGLTERDIRDAQRPVWADPAPVTVAPSAAAAPLSAEPSRGWVHKVGPWLALAVLTVAFVLAWRARTRNRLVGPSDEQQSSTTGGGNR